MVERVRQIIQEHGRLPVDLDALDDDADLYQAGMTSHASVNLMLALEAAFDVEFPDAMLKRSVFQSVALDQRGAPDARARGGMSVAIDRDQAFLDAIRRIADEVAAPNADDVDREARFPVETIDALRAERALSAPRPRGVRRRRRLASRRSRPRASSSAVAAARAPWSSRCTRSRSRLRRPARSTARRGSRPTCATSRASSGSSRRSRPRSAPVATSGDRSRRSRRASDGRATFEKQAPTVSYGAYADDLLTTLRRSPDAEPGDQVVALTNRDQITLEQTGTWDPLGMRGTCSPGLHGPRRVRRRTRSCRRRSRRSRPKSMVPVSHVLWSHLWLGIATDAFDRARAFVRASAKQRPARGRPADGAAPVAPHERARAAAGRGRIGAARLHRGLREPTVNGSRRWPRSCASTTSRSRRPSRRRASARARWRCAASSATRTTRPFSVGRHLRDTMSASLMVANERIHQTNASLLLIAKDV